MIHEAFYLAWNADGKLHRLAEQLQSRIEWLEALVRSHVPDVSLDPAVIPPAPSRGQSRTVSSSISASETANQVTSNDGSAHGPSEHSKSSSDQNIIERAQSSSTPATTITGSQIGPEQPLTHEVGLLSLANAASDPKYLGPSSGVSFARLIYAAASQSQGLPSDWRTARQGSSVVVERASGGGASDAVVSEAPKCVPLPQIQDMHRFIDAYFNEFQHSYPFLQEDWIDQVLEEKYATTSDVPQFPVNNSDIDMAILFLVAALGAKALEAGVHIDLNSSNYLSSAMAHVAGLTLHDSVQGVQVMLLLVLAGFSFQGGLNAWFLTHTIIASCLDLGLQRKTPMNKSADDPRRNAVEEDVRAGVFWSAYSLDRTLCTILGRPLTLRDEALDIEFPGEAGTNNSKSPIIDIPDFLTDPSATPFAGGPAAKRPRYDHSILSPYTPANFCFRFDRITAEIKLMLHRVVQVPSRFPWPTDFHQWRQEAHSACNAVLAAAKRTLTSRRAIRSRRVLPAIEIKYHQCVMLLFRPSPAMPQPTADAISHCFTSAVEVIRIHNDLLRFGEMANSWLTAHLVFVSGITMLYAVWVVPGVLLRTTNHTAHSTATASQTMTTAFDDMKLMTSIKACSDVLAHLGITWSVARDAKDKFDKLAALTQGNMSNLKSRGIQQIASGEIATTWPLDNGNLHDVPDVSRKNGSIPSGSQPGNHSLGVDLLSSQAENGNQMWPNDASNETEGWDFGDLTNFETPDFMWEQLGDIRTLFDLDWMG